VYHRRVVVWRTGKWIRFEKFSACSTINDFVSKLEGKIGFSFGMGGNAGGR
jgi:hypothetical protein